MTSPPPSLETLLGKTLLTAPKKSSATKGLLQSKEFVVLYFSASWCPPCRAFTPVLKDFYEKNKSAVEIIFLSSDQSEKEFAEYFAKMPWLAVAHENGAIKKNLADMCKIRGIPCGIVLNAEGRFISNKGREEIQQKKANLVDEWRQREPLSIEEGIAQASEFSPGGALSQMFFGLLRNPIYIFGLLYIVKWLTRKFAGEEDVAAVGDIPPSAGDEPISDDEF